MFNVNSTKWFQMMVRYARKGVNHIKRFQNMEPVKNVDHIRPLARIRNHVLKLRVKATKLCNSMVDAKIAPTMKLEDRKEGTVWYLNAKAIKG